MSSYDSWLEEPAQAAAIASERAEWIDAHTCPECGELGVHELAEGEPCLSCCARTVA
jgi:hypothetical protein